MTEREQVSVTVAAELLGVRKETIYAYVSRGVLDRTHATGEDGRRVSLLDLAQVRDLAAQGHRPRSGRFELSIDSSISELDAQGRLAYRGQDAVTLAEHHSSESVAQLLWQQDPTEAWHPDPGCSDRCRRTAAAAPANATPSDRARIALSLLAAETSTVSDHDSARAAIITCARVLAPEPVAWSGDVATTATAALALGQPRQADIHLIRRALVLLADHELATSTVAVRAAAGTGVSLPHALLTGAASLAGPLHGQASVAAERTLRRWLADGELDDVAGGFGHRVYAEADPRAEDLLRSIFLHHPELEEPVQDLTLRVLRRDGHHPNVDLALAALSIAVPLRPGSGEGIFLLARLAGMTAHALEERDQPLRFRPRAIYTGVAGSGPT